MGSKVVNTYNNLNRIQVSISFYFSRNENIQVFITFTPLRMDVPLLWDTVVHLDAWSALCPLLEAEER